MRIVTLKMNKIFIRALEIVKKVDVLGLYLLTISYYLCVSHYMRTRLLGKKMLKTYLPYIVVTIEGTLYQLYKCRSVVPHGKQVGLANVSMTCDEKSRRDKSSFFWQ